MAPARRAARRVISALEGDSSVRSAPTDCAVGASAPRQGPSGRWAPARFAPALRAAVVARPPVLVGEAARGSARQAAASACAADSCAVRLGGAQLLAAVAKAQSPIILRA